MKKLFLMILFVELLNSDTYMGKIEPYQKYSVQAEIGGIVNFVNRNKEFSYFDKKTKIIEIDSSNEQITINSLKERILILKNILKLKQTNLTSKKRVRQISKYDINRETLSVLETKASLNSLKMELNLKENIVKKKNLSFLNIYLDKIYVSEFEFVVPNEKLFDYFDISKSRLDIFVDSDEVKNIEFKDIFINGKKVSNWKIEKISKVKDSKRISTYFVKLIKDNLTFDNKFFGQIVTIEFKNREK